MTRQCNGFQPINQPPLPQKQHNIFYYLKHMNKNYNKDKHHQLLKYSEDLRKQGKFIEKESRESYLTLQKSTTPKFGFSEYYITKSAIFKNSLRKKTTCKVYIFESKIYEIYSPQNRTLKRMIQNNLI